jgi:hypothetical protein
MKSKIYWIVIKNKKTDNKIIILAKKINHIIIKIKNTTNNNIINKKSNLIYLIQIIILKY